MFPVPSEKSYSPDEYLAIERAAESKNEFHDGRIYAMTGASREHSLITANIARELTIQFKNRPCEAYINDMRVGAAGSRNYFYPDVAVICGKPDFEDAQVDTLLNPTVLIEVLSPSTEAYDRGDKFAQYRKIPSLQEYLLLSPNRPRMERYARQGELWVLHEAEGLEAYMVLEAIGCTLTLREVYDKVLDDRADTARSV